MRKKHKQIICESLNYCVEKKGLEIFAYKIMSSHLHMIARAKNCDLSNLIRDFKKFISAMLLQDFKNSNESRKVWLLDLFNKGRNKR